MSPAGDAATAIGEWSTRTDGASAPWGPATNAPVARLYREMRSLSYCPRKAYAPSGLMAMLTGPRPVSGLFHTTAFVAVEILVSELASAVAVDPLDPSP